MVLKSSSSWIGALSIIILAIISGCAETAHVMKDNSVDVRRYKTYAWVQKPVSKDTASNHKNELTERSIRNAVSEQLQKRGYTESPTNPDVLVSTDLLVEKDQERRSDAVYTEPYTQNYYNPRTGRLITYYFPSQFAGFDSYSTTVRKGTLTLTFIDSRTDKAVWQGWASKRLNSTNMDDDEIFQDVRSIFNKFDGN